MRFAYGQISKNWLFIRKFELNLVALPKKEKIRAITARILINIQLYGGHERSLPHLHNRVQTSNKAHDKFVPRRDCACADHSHPSLSTALLSGWSPHLHNRVAPHNPLVPSTLARERQAYPLQARLGYAGAERSASHLVIIMFQLAFPLSQARTP